MKADCGPVSPDQWQYQQYIIVDSAINQIRPIGQGALLIDTSFRAEIGPKLFNILADLLSWILEQQQVSPVLHYLDDFLTMGSQQSTTSAKNLTAIMKTCSMLSIPLALEKVSGPSYCLTFLGITLDTRLMQTHLPNDKLK